MHTPIFMYAWYHTPPSGEMGLHLKAADPGLIPPLPEGLFQVSHTTDF